MLDLRPPEGTHSSLWEQLVVMGNTGARVVIPCLTMPGHSEPWRTSREREREQGTHKCQLWEGPACCMIKQSNLSSESQGSRRIIWAKPLAGVCEMTSDGNLIRAVEIVQQGGEKG